MRKVTSIQTYQKGSWILHMLRGVLGTDTFWKGIRIYYNKFQNSNASTEDFKDVMESVSNKDLDQFFEQWLYKPGILKLKGNWFFDKKNKELNINLNQVQTEDILFEMPIEIGIEFENRQDKLEVITLKNKSNSFKIVLEKEPVNVILDPNYWVLMNQDFSKSNYFKN